MKILVTGGKGFLGKNVTEALRNAGHKVSAPSSKDCDLHDMEKLLEHSAGMDCIVHLAARLQHADDTNVLEDNNAINTNVLDAAQKNDVKQVIAIGTVLMYRGATASPPYREEALEGATIPDFKRAYAESKVALFKGIQALHKEHGTNTIFLLLPNLFGEHDHFVEGKAHFIPTAIARITEAANKHLPSLLFHGPGEGRREFVYAHDAAQTIALLVGKPGHHVLNMGSGDVFTPREAAEHIARIIGYTGTIDFPEGKTEELWLDDSKLRALIGTVPHTPFDTSLKNTIAYYTMQKHE